MGALVNEEIIDLLLRFSYSIKGRDCSIKLRFSKDFIVIFFSIVKFLKLKIKQLYFYPRPKLERGLCLFELL